MRPVLIAIENGVMFPNSQVCNTVMVRSYSSHGFGCVINEATHPSVEMHDGRKVVVLVQSDTELFWQRHKLPLIFAL